MAGRQSGKHSTVYRRLSHWKNPFLEKNYRSAQPIIEAAQVILKDTDRIEPEKRLKAFSKVMPILARSFWHRNAGNRFHSEKDSTLEPGRTNRFKWYCHSLPLPQHGRKISSFFLKERIPFQMAAGRNVTDHPIMKRFLLYLKIIRDPSDPLLWNSWCFTNWASIFLSR